MTQETILVTGGSGLVGKSLKSLVDKSEYSKKTWIFTSSRDYDLCDPSQTAKLFESRRPSTVVHLAGIVLGGTSTDEQQWKSWIDNVKIHCNVLDCCKKFKVRRVMSFLTTAMVENTSDIWLSSGPSLSENGHYGYIHSKRVLQVGLKSLQKHHNVECLVFCPSNMYGSTDLKTSDRLIPSLYRKILGPDKELVLNLDPSTTKSLLYAQDMAQIIQNHIVEPDMDWNELPFPYYVIPPELSISNIVDTMKRCLHIDKRVEYIGKIVPKCSLPQMHSVEFEWTLFEKGFGMCCASLIRKISLGEFVNTPAITERVVSVLNSGRLSYGDESKRFEQDFAKMHDSKFAVLSNSGTSSLQVALAAMKEHFEWDDGDAILVPAITFVASINTILQTNLQPILVDVDPVHYEIDPVHMRTILAENVDKYVKKTIRAVMVVHLFGQPCDMQPIQDISKKYNLRILEDSCETMCAKYQGRSVGSLGDIGCFSTYVAHLLVTGVGGIATTNNNQLAILMRSLVNHGRNNIYLSIDDDKNITSDQQFKEIISKRFEFQRVGFSYRITELEAAIANVELPLLADRIRKRQQNAHYLISEFQRHGLDRYLQLPQIRETNDHVFMMFPLVLNPKTAENRTKQELLFHLERCCIETRDLMPITNQPVYQSKAWNWNPHSHFLVANSLNQNGFYIGCHCFLVKEDLDYIVTSFRDFFKVWKS
jgi:perosamine synthetase